MLRTLMNTTAALIGLSVASAAALPVLAAETGAVDVLAAVDINRSIETKAVLTRIDWMDPHTIMHFDITLPDGMVQKNVLIESLGIASLRQVGIDSNTTLQVGGTYTITYYPYRDGEPGGFISKMVLPDGRTFVMTHTDPTFVAAAEANLRPSAEQQQLNAVVPSQLADLSVFQGTSTCVGTQGDSLFGSAHPIQTNVTGKADLGGFWLNVRYEDQKTADNDHPTTGVYSFTYEAATKLIVAVWTDSLAGYGIQTSRGWQGDTLVLVGDYNAAGQAMGARDTFQKTSAGIVNHLSELQVQGQWEKLYAETCSPSPPNVAVR